MPGIYVALVIGTSEDPFVIDCSGAVDGVLDGSTVDGALSLGTSKLCRTLGLIMLDLLALE